VDATKLSRPSDGVDNSKMESLAAGLQVGANAMVKSQYIGQLVGQYLPSVEIYNQPLKEIVKVVGDAWTLKPLFETSDKKLCSDIRNAMNSMIEQLPQYAKVLGIGDKDATALIEKKTQELHLAGNAGELLVKGDLPALQKLMTNKDGASVNLELLAQLLKTSGLNLRAEVKHGNLLLSHPGDDFAVCIGADGQSKMMGVQNGAHPRYYDADFCDENVQASLKEIVSKAQKNEFSRCLLMESIGASKLLPDWSSTNKRKPWSNNDAMLYGAETSAER
jgi:hypothetical protein